jgi:hypothetical protein
MAFALLSKSQSKTQGSVKPGPKRKSARVQRPADSQFGFAKPVFQPSTPALPTVPVIQTKLKVREPDDEFEQEAERVAELTGNDKRLNSAIRRSAGSQSCGEPGASVWQSGGAPNAPWLRRPTNPFGAVAPQPGGDTAAQVRLWESDDRRGMQRVQRKEPIGSANQTQG